MVVPEQGFTTLLMERNLFVFSASNSMLCCALDKLSNYIQSHSISFI